MIHIIASLLSSLLIPQHATQISLAALKCLEAQVWNPGGFGHLESEQSKIKPRAQKT